MGCCAFISTKVRDKYFYMIFFVGVVGGEGRPFLVEKEGTSGLGNKSI
jgi:hypothetical protein